jgi:pyruvate-ferredoxin/flavodoxin oxidoreductase
VPLTIADWAATEGRFKQHFHEVAPDSWTDAMMPFHEFVALPPDERDGHTPYVLAAGKDRRLRRLAVSAEIVTLAEERLHFWSQLRQLAGLEIAPAVRDMVADSLEAELEQRVAAVRAEYEAKLAEVRASYRQQIARRLAEGLLRHGSGPAIADLLSTLPGTARSGNGDGTAAPPSSPAEPARPTAAVAVAPAAVAPPTAATSTAAAPALQASPAAAPSAVMQTTPAAEAEDEALSLEAYIDSARCTSCNECTNLNRKMFAYNADKQAYVKDASAGTYQQLVVAAEHCPVSIIHPGTPLNPKEKDLEKWVKRGTKFN